MYIFQLDVIPFRIKSPFEKLDEIVITKIRVVPLIYPQGARFSPLPLVDNLYYSTDFDRIWYMLSLTIMKSIAITKIMGVEILI